MDMTRDKLCSLIKKKQSILEASTDVRTADGYIVRMFCIAFTKKQEGQQKVTCYAKATQIRAIRAKMIAVMTELGSKGDLKALVKELISGTTGEQIEKEAGGIFPIHECYIRKVKVLKKPKFDVTSLMEWHTDDVADTGTPVAAPEAEESLVAGSGGRL